MNQKIIEAMLDKTYALMVFIRQLQVDQKYFSDRDFSDWLGFTDALEKFLKSRILKPMSIAPRDRKIRVDTGDGNVLVLSYTKIYGAWFCWSKDTCGWVQGGLYNQKPTWRGWMELEVT